MSSVLPHVPQAGTTRRWFADGDAWLAIDRAERDDPLLDTLHDAVLLGEVDALLRRVAHVCDRDFDWRPATGHGPLRVTVSDAPDRLIALALPDPLQARLLAASVCAAGPAERGGEPAPTVRPNEGADKPLGIVAHRQHAHVELDRVTLDAEDSERLTPGALLLLPASFEPRWRATLAVGTGEPVRLPVLIDIARGVMRARSGTLPGATDVLPACVLTVALVAKVEIALDQWSNDVEIDCDLTDGVAVVIDRMEGTSDAESGDTLPAHTGFTGRLIALGRGHAVRLDTDD